MEAERITKNQCKEARQRAVKIIQKVREKLKDKYKFSERLVGSGKWGTMIKDANGEYDLDYQILLTKNSKEYKNNGLKHSTDIKNDFFNAFNDCKLVTETIENSTTAITLVNKDNKPFHIDFVIIRVLPDNDEIIRRNNKTGTPSINEFTWNELPDWNPAYDKFKSLTPKQKEDVIVNYIIPAKVIEKEKDENDFTKLSSAQVFVREVNNYVYRIENN